MAEQLYYGKYRATVADIEDPEKRARIRVTCPKVLGKGESDWCEPCIPVSYDGGGDFCLPPVGEAIWVEFEDGDVRYPIWSGGWFSVEKTPLGKEYANKDKLRIISFKGVQIALQEGSVTTIAGDKALILDAINIEILNWCIANKESLAILVEHLNNTVYYSENRSHLEDLINKRSEIDGLVAEKSDLDYLAKNRGKIQEIINIGLKDVLESINVSLQIADEQLKTIFEELVTIKADIEELKNK